MKGLRAELSGNMLKCRIISVWHREGSRSCDVHAEAFFFQFSRTNEKGRNEMFFISTTKASRKARFRSLYNLGYPWEQYLISRGKITLRFSLSAEGPEDVHES